jgi:hypothetical protein
MMKVKRESRVDIYFNENCLVIGISGDIMAGTIDAILNKLSIVQVKKEDRKVDLILDLSKVHFVSPAAAVGIICLCSSLNTNKIKGIANLSSFYLNHPAKHVLTYLTTLGFFTQMSVKAGLLGCEDLIHFEHEKRQRSKKKQKASLNNQSNNNNRPIVWPIETIPRKGESISDQDFEDACQYFINHAAGHFEKLFSSFHFNFDKGDRHGFWEANGELYINIFEHSQSWGLGTIHARPNYGTTVCYYDIGIGIKDSVNSSPNLGKEFDKFESDYEAMKWALVEGHSSKLNGNGIGLNIVEDFVLSRNGTIWIRSGQCLLQKKSVDQSGSENWRYRNVLWFPGTQINFFVPCITIKSR